MKAVVIPVVVVLALFCLFEIGLSIQCYECNSYYQQDCADHFNNYTINQVDCSTKIANATRCRKIIQEIWFDDHWDVRYIRQCAAIGRIGDYEGRECIERAGTYKVKVRYCHCDNQDGCNSATSISSTTALVFSVVAFLVQKLVR